MPSKRKGRRARGTGAIFFSESRTLWIGRKTINDVRVERWGASQGEVVKKLEAVEPPGPDTMV